LVVRAGVLLGFDINRAHQSAVLATGQVAARDHVGVIEAEARRAGHKGDAPHTARGDVGSALLGGAVDVDADLLAVPVQVFGSVGVVVDVHPRPLALFQPHQRTGELTVIDDGRHDLIRGQLDSAGGDSQCVLRLAVGRGQRRGSRTSNTADCGANAAEYGHAAIFEEIASIDRHGFASLAVGGSVKFDHTVDVIGEVAHAGHFGGRDRHDSLLIGAGVVC
jgi:hypothetical protein